MKIKTTLSKQHLSYPNVQIHNYVYDFPFIENPEWIISRTYSEHMILMGDSRNKKGYICKPVMQLEPTSCPPDLLHMKKAIITKLMNQVVDWVILQGKEEQLIAQMKEHRIPFMYVLPLTVL